jgi:hypothetical protein
MGLADYEGPNVKSQRIPVTATRLPDGATPEKAVLQDSFFYYEYPFLGNSG